MTGRLNGHAGAVKWAGGVLAAVVASIVATYFSTQSTTETTIRERLVKVETLQNMQYAEVLRRLETLDGKFDRVLNDFRNGVDRRTGEPLALQYEIDRRERER